MGLFDKKYCDVCGEKIGLFGNRKLEDGNLCKNCAAKLSPWFDDRRHSTVEQIKDQLAYREENETVLKEFRPTKIFGKNSMKVYVDANKKQFVVAEKYNDGENHDVIDLSQIMNCYMDVEENKEEKFRKDSEGNDVSFNPPRYEYSYEYYVYIAVDSPYFDEIKIRINDEDIAQNNYSVRRDVENICKEIVEYLMGKQEEKKAAEEEKEKVEQEAVNSVWTCQSCGAANTGRFCEYCGTPRR